MKISFIMLTWNRKRFLEKCLTSFYQQKVSLSDYELLLLDNGSDDGTSDYLDEIARQDPHVKLIKNSRNKGLSQYKRLLKKAKGEYIVILDDDVIEFPDQFDSKMIRCIEQAKDFGFLALDVVQNEYTNGAKPGKVFYREQQRGDFMIQEGPTGGWCVMMRRSDFRKIRFRFYLSSLNMKTGEDGTLHALMRRKLGLKAGIIQGLSCFHATGPYYSKMYGCLDRDIEKYRMVGLDEFVNEYEKLK